MYSIVNWGCVATTQCLSGECTPNAGVRGAITSFSEYRSAYLRVASISCAGQHAWRVRAHGSAGARGAPRCRCGWAVWRVARNVCVQSPPPMSQGARCQVPRVRCQVLDDSCQLRMHRQVEVMQQAFARVHLQTMNGQLAAMARLTKAKLAFPITLVP
jgi:hypothetical protein